MKTVILIAVGGGAGTLLRFFLSKVAFRMLGIAPFLGTFCVNMVGSFLIGLLFSPRLTFLSDSARSILVIGLLGGFTTFSSFSLESVELLKDRSYGKAASYIFASSLGCPTLTWLSSWIFRG